LRAVSYKSHIICQVAFVILFLWDKRFLTETKNVFEGKDYIRTNEYDPVFGVINSATDVNGFTTQYKYDNFGRLKKEIAPDGYQASSVLRWVQNSDQHAPENALYYKWSKKSGMAEAITYFDYQGRLLRSVNIGLDNEKLYADKEYYALGNVKKSSLPYFAGNSPIWTTYNYDDLQRLEYVNSPISTIKTIYDGRKKTITNVNTEQSKSKEVNAIGQTIIETVRLGKL
jgi:YD repeat-containing protein